MPAPYILLVDDYPATLEFLAVLLQTEGFVVRTAKSVLRALELLHDGSPPPALIITDLLMPGTTGWDFMKHLRDDATLASVPVIVVSGAEPGEGLELAGAVLQKPLDPTTLIETVRRLFPPPGQTRNHAGPRTII